MCSFFLLCRSLLMSFFLLSLIPHVILGIPAVFLVVVSVIVILVMFSLSLS